jgi:hypothetical protein
MPAKPKLVKKQKASNTATYPLKFDRTGQYINTPEQGRIELIALYCDCGQSVYVTPKAAARLVVTCRNCSSEFRWQQLSFADLNAA